MPAGALLYLKANNNETHTIDDDGVEVGVEGTLGGFSSVYITKENMTVTFYDQNGTVLYSSFALPRTVGNPKDEDLFMWIINSVPQLTPLGMVVLIILVFILCTMVIYFCPEPVRVADKQNTVEMIAKREQSNPLLAAEAGKK